MLARSVRGAVGQPLQLNRTKCVYPTQCLRRWPRRNSPITANSLPSGQPSASGPSQRGPQRPQATAIAILPATVREIATIASSCSSYSDSSANEDEPSLPIQAARTLRSDLQDSGAELRVVNLAGEVAVLQHGVVKLAQDAELGQGGSPGSSCSDSSSRTRTCSRNGSASDAEYCGVSHESSGGARHVLQAPAAGLLQQQQTLQPTTLDVNSEAQTQSPDNNFNQSSKRPWDGLPWTKIWGLTILSVSYVHQATTGFALPAMLPMIAPEMHMGDMQGALLTTGYSYLYALALIPVGLLADKVVRPKLLAAGLAVWSALTITASNTHSFNELLASRIGFAAAQSTQNPICFSLIPELFPKQKSTALAIYNCAIYAGRALSFYAVLLARQLSCNDDLPSNCEVTWVRMDNLDLQTMSIIYTSGDMAAVTPIYDYGLNALDSDADGSWRTVLRWIAIPGFLIALAMLFTVAEPRTAQQAQQAGSVVKEEPKQQQASGSVSSGQQQQAVQQHQLAVVPIHSSRAIDRQAIAAAASLPAAMQPSAAAVAAAAAATAASTAIVPAAAAAAVENVSPQAGVMMLLSSPAFMATTFAAALNDVGSYALIAWQSTFYERVYDIGSQVYAPILACVLPIGGIIGGVGGGWLADVLAKRGSRVWITAGASILAAPFLLDSCMAGSYQESFLALLVGFALSEAWRAPSANMARSVAPANMGSTASAIYLCIRNLVGGAGPLGVAKLAEYVGLQRAMMLVPAMYLASGAMFALAEHLFAQATDAPGTQRKGE